MNNDELIASLAKTLASVAKTLEMTRAELDGLRTVFIGVLTAVSRDPNAQDLIARAIAGAAEGDAAHALTTPMSDEMLQKREDWIQRLTPPHIRPLVQRYRGNRG